ncbi:MAG TPA: DUF2946 family protein [Bacteroidota bacterium]|nr:DUF2946 family protein [Bacteroidota bacterium]
MPTYPRRILSAFLLIVYAASLLLVMSPHTDAETAFGSGKTSIANHADADHCKHVNASQGDTCPLCSSFAARAPHVSTPLVLEAVAQTAVVPPPTLSSTYSLFLLSSFSRRGPPSLLA